MVKNPLSCLVIRGIEQAVERAGIFLLIAVLVTPVFPKCFLESFLGSSIYRREPVNNGLNVWVILTAESDHTVVVIGNAIVAIGFFERGDILGDIVTIEQVYKAIL